MNWGVAPTATLGLAGVTAMETSVAAETVNTVEPETLPDVAEMVVVPMVSVDASPAVLMVATLSVAEAQVTLDVRSSVELSE